MIHIASIQMAPIFLDSAETWKKLSEFIVEAASNNAEFVTWGETLIPGYPVWISRSQGARFDDPVQKRVYAKYWQEAVILQESKIINEMRKLAKEFRLMMMGGILEKASGSTYFTLITVGKNG